MSHRSSIKASHIKQGRLDRLNAARQQREHKRAQLLEAKRTISAPRLVTIFPLSQDVDLTALWHGLLDASETSSSKAASKSDREIGEHRGVKRSDDIEMNVSDEEAVVKTVTMPDKSRMRFTFVPPPKDRSDPLAVVDVARSADVIVFAVSCSSKRTRSLIDSDGEMALSILRAMGMPSMVTVVQFDTDELERKKASGAPPVASLKIRSAAKKSAMEAFSQHIGGEHKFMHADNPSDFKQLLRHLADSAVVIPYWRRQRPQIIAEAAEFVLHQEDNNNAVQSNGSYQGAGNLTGKLAVCGFVRGQPLSAVQAVHLCGEGDFQIHSIEAVQEPLSSKTTTHQPNPDRNMSGGMDIDDDNRHAETCSKTYPVLASLPPEQRESLQRENEVNPLEGEQTWPTEEELAEAKAQQRVRRRRLPKGTSEYQAAWIVDEDDDDDKEYDEYDDYDNDMSVREAEEKFSGNEEASLPDLELACDGTATEVDGMDYIEEDIGDERYRAELADVRSRKNAEDEDARFPDEVDVPLDVPARQRLARYRGLKSFRTSPWDPREDLPADYARVFAFENFKKAHRRAKDAIAEPSIPEASVPVGFFVRVVLDNVPAMIGTRVVERVTSSTRAGGTSLVSMFGLMQHETKLSVVNFSIQKKGTYREPIANKEELLFVTGVRCFSARPILSTDEHGADKHKMERFLHEGRQTVATIYAPIMFPPAPVLAFKEQPGRHCILAASGTLRDCNPDRIVLKKVVLTGYPVRQHKSKAVVRFMFHNPDDVRWFRPVELYTKHGRRGRIREPVGTHGTMKCIFDGPVSQQDAICMSLYKRVYPKWPTDLTFP